MVDPNDSKSFRVYTDRFVNSSMDDEDVEMLHGTLNVNYKHKLLQLPDRFQAYKAAEKHFLLDFHDKHGHLPESCWSLQIKEESEKGWRSLFTLRNQHYHPSMDELDDWENKQGELFEQPKKRFIRKIRQVDHDGWLIPAEIDHFTARSTQAAITKTKISMFGVDLTKRVDNHDNDSIYLKGQVKIKEIGQGNDWHIIHDTDEMLRPRPGVEIGAYALIGLGKTLEEERKKRGDPRQYRLFQ